MLLRSEHRVSVFSSLAVPVKPLSVPKKERKDPEVTRLEVNA